MSDKTWAMNCVLAGVETAIFMRQGHPDIAREKLATLTLELTPEDVEYLMKGIQDLLQLQATGDKNINKE